MNRRNRTLGVVERAVFLAVGEAPGPDSATEKRGPQVAIEGGVLLAGVQQAGIPANDFAPRVSRQPFEGRIAVLNISLRVRDQNLLGSLLHRGNQAGALRFRAPSVGRSQQFLPLRGRTGLPKRAPVALGL